MTFQSALLRRHIPHRMSGDRTKCSINCPFCQERGKPEDNRFRLAVHTQLGWAHCVHCGYSRRHGVFAVLKQLGITEQVNGFEHQEAAPEERVTLPADFQTLVRAYDDLDRQARKYVLDRGITKEQIVENRIGVSYAGKFAYRIVFPVYDKGNLVGINSRDFTGHGTPKYLTSHGTKHLYHFDPQAHTVVLSEGVFKALRIAQVTTACSSALLGHTLTEAQTAQLRASRAERVILYPDTDAAGRQGFIKVADHLVEDLGYSVSVAYPVDLPADEAPLETLRHMLQNPLPYCWNTRQKLRRKADKIVVASGGVLG